MDIDDDPDDEDADDAEEEIPPPDAWRVAARCGVFAALAYRAALESNPTWDDRKGRHGRLIAWIDGTVICDELEPTERALLETPLGRLSAADVRDGSWLVEPAAVLAWSLSRFELPRYDRLVQADEVADAIAFQKSPWTLPDEAMLRDEDEIEEAWASALTVHWRLREYGLRPAPMDFERFIRECAWAPLTPIGLRLRGGDLLLRGRSLAKAAGDVFDECRQVAPERHRALEWLRGGNAVLWSDVTADT